MVAIEDVSAEKWEQALTEATHRADAFSHAVLRRGPSAYRAMSVEQRHELWLGIVLSGNTAAGHRILDGLRDRHLPGAPDLHAEALRELRFAADRIAREGSMMRRAPTPAQLDATVRETIAGPPASAAEVEAAAVLAGDPPPRRPSGAQLQQVLRIHLTATQKAASFQSRHGANPGEAAIGAGAEAFVPSVRGELEGQIVGEIVDPPAAAGRLGFTSLITLLGAIERGWDAHRRARDPDYAKKRALHDEIWRIAADHPPPGTAHLPVGDRAEAIRRWMIDTLERQEQFDVWLRRHPEHPQHPSRR